MCGFVGIFSKCPKRFDEGTLHKMASMIAHRGPDDSGYFADGDWLSLEFRRLSILDLSAKGHQPMLSRDGRYALVFNGEIYNFRELRKELEAKGSVFISDTDTEIILEAYQAWGKDCLRKFTGMFAFIIADLKEKSAFIARDPLGIKPLFFYEDAGYFIFCSEMKALLPYTSLQPEPASVNEYLVFRSLPGRETLFRNVFNLLPGHYIEFSGGGISEREYFDIASTLKPDYSRSFQDTCGEIEKKLDESVSIHLRSDVELGVQLSGGVDSSLITAMASAKTGKKFHTFSISFSESFYDESEYQKRISTRYNTEHHDYPMNEDTFTGFLHKAVWHYEHPLNDPNAVATYYLCKKAREYITVMLSGEGADETFMGYARFGSDAQKRMKLRSLLYRHPLLRETLFRTWPFKKGSALFNITRYDPSMYVLTYADLNKVDKLLKGNDSGIKFRKSISEKAGADVLNATILHDQACDLMQWFWRADRMGMAESMELRVPFCTVPMFKAANSIPYEQRVLGGEKKAVLKKIAEKYMDKDQIYRKKIGFGTPINDWINRKGPYSELYDNTMNSEAFKSREFINHSHFREMYDAHKSGKFKEVNSAFLWTYFNLEIWFKIFFEGQWKQLC